MDPDIDLSINKQKLRKILIYTVLWLLNDFLKNDVNAPSKKNKHENFYWKTDEKKQDPDLDPVATGPHPDPYQSGTLPLAMQRTLDKARIMEGSAHLTECKLAK